MFSIESTTTENIRSGTAYIGMIVLVGGSANSEVIINDSTDGSGTDKIRLKALANDTRIIPFGEEGFPFSTGIYSTLSGTGAKVFVYIK